MLFLNVGINILVSLAFATSPPSSMKWASNLGLEFDGKTMYVKKADKTKFAGVIGVEANDTIVAINGLVIKNTEQFENTVKELAEKSFEPWQFTVQRQVNGKNQKLKLQPDPKYRCNPLRPIGCGKLRP